MNFSICIVLLSAKKHLALLVAGCFFFLFTFTCLSIPVGRIGLFSIMATRRVVSSTAISLLPSNIGLFSNNEFLRIRDRYIKVYCPLISGCSLTPSPPVPINKPWRLTPLRISKLIYGFFMVTGTFAQDCSQQ